MSFFFCCAVLFLCCEFCFCVVRFCFYVVRFVLVLWVLFSCCEFCFRVLSLSATVHRSLFMGGNCCMFFIVVSETLPIVNNFHCDINFF